MYFPMYRPLNVLKLLYLRPEIIPTLSTIFWLTVWFRAVSSTIALFAVMRIQAGFFGSGFDLTAKHRIRIRNRIRQ
jgi:hypothetical protein